MTAPCFRRLLVIHNPAAGQRKARRLAACLELLRAGGCTVELASTDRPGHGRDLAAAADGRYDAVVAAGGDGTINEVANGLVGGTLPLAVIPLGTANVLAIDIGLRCSPPAVAAAILAGRLQRIHLGRVGQRVFVMMLGVGFDAAVVETVDLALKRRAGKLAYVTRTLGSCLSYGFPPLAVTIDGVATPATGLVVLNGRHYGGPFVAAPEGSLANPGLHACVLRGSGAGSVLLSGLALAAGRLACLDDVTLLPARTFQVDGPAGLPVQADGDIVARLPIEVTVAACTLDVVVPA